MSELFDDLEDFGSFDDAVSGDVRDPYPELARLRREEPIQRIDMSAMPGEAGKPVFIVYRYEDAQQMLRDNITFSSSGVIAAFGPVLGERVMLGMDEPVHGRLRGLVSKAFSQKALAQLQDELVARVGNELIDKFAANGSADLVKEFTFDYPSRIIAGLLGLPEEDYPQFQRWSISLLSWIMKPERGLAAAAALCEYFAPILEARRAEPADDIISLARRGRDRRREAHRRRDLLVPSAAAARRGGDHVSVAGQLVVRFAHRHRTTRGDSRRQVPDSAGDRGSRAMESAAADDHQDHHLRDRTRRSDDSRGVFGASDARVDEPAGGSVGEPRRVQHLPHLQGQSRLGPRCSRLSRACTLRGSKCARPSTFCSTDCQTYAWIPTATIRTSAGRCSGRQRRCR